MDTDLDKGLRIGILDIESGDLKANAPCGYVICACLKTVNKQNLLGPTSVFRIDDPDNPNKGSDKWVIKRLVEEMDKFDLIITWYGSRFDIPFINSRALKHGLKIPQRNYRRDLCFVARANGNLYSNRLGVWGDFLFGQSIKTKLASDKWLGAIRGDSRSISYLVTHCKADVLETEKIYKEFIPLLGKLRKG